MRRIYRLLLFTLFIISANFAYANQLLNIQVIGQNQLILRFKEPPKYHSFTLNNPERLVIDIQQTSLSQSVMPIPLGSLPIKSIRTSINQEKTLRVVFDLTSKQSSRFYLLPDGPGRPWSLSVTLTQHFSSIPSSTSKPKTVPQKTLPSKQKTTPPSPKNKTATPSAKATYQPKKVIIVIDAGHGGKDPGAHGIYGTHEKKVVLSIAQQLSILINQQPGMHAVLTRQGDYYINLRQRLTLARKNSGDLFISIHADAFSNTYSHGASVFALSEKGGTSEAARWLAAKENYSELGGVDLNGLDDKNGMVRSVLIDLSETATIGASLELGGCVLRSMGNVTTLHHHRVEQARFVVLKSLDIPSILIETGFISNPKEEKNLSNSAHQTQLAKAILRGIQCYLAQHPPANSSYWVKK